MMRQSRQKFFAFFATIGYLLLLAYFGLIAFAYLFGRDPNRGLASFAILVCVFCVWRLLCSVRRVFRRRAIQEEKSDKAADATSSSTSK